MAAVRLGLLGAGRWGQVYITTIGELADRCRLSHVFSRNPETATRVPPSTRVSAEWRAVIESDCDGVIIATPPATHAELLEACLAAGKPCLVEKPLCLDAETAARLHARAQAAAVPVLVNHTQLFNPAYAALTAALRDAREPIRVLVADDLAFGPFRTHTPALWDWGPHPVSLCLDLLGATPTAVDALAGPRNPRGEAEMVALRLAFAGGATAWIQVGSLGATKRRQLAVFTDHLRYLFDDTGPIKLTRAAIDWPARYTTGPADPGAGSPVAIADPARPMAVAVAAFVDGITGGPRDRFGTALACDVVRVLAAAQSHLQQKEPGAHAHVP